MFKIKSGYYLKLLTSETMKLLGSTERKITKDKNGENVPHLEVVQLVLVHCNLVNNDYQQDSRILCTFVPNKTFGSFLEISPTNNIFLKTLNSEFQEIKIWFTDQRSNALEIEDRIWIMAWIECNSVECTIQLNLEKEDMEKGYGFLPFAKNIGKNISNKYGQILVDTARKSATDATKTASKRAIQETGEAT